MAIAGITLLGIIWSNKQTRKSNELLEKDLTIRLRPWLLIEELVATKAILDDSSMMPWQKYLVDVNDVNRLRLAIFESNVKNVGLMPLKKLSGWVYAQINTKPTLDDIKTKGEKISLPLMINESYPLGSELSQKTIKQLDHDTIFWACHFEYEINGIVETTGKIFSNHRGIVKIIDYW